MLNGPSVSYQPSTVYQGQAPLSAPEQEPRSGQTQPREAAAADSQRSNEEKTGSDGGASSRQGGRGSTLDIQA